MERQSLQRSQGLVSLFVSCVNPVQSVVLGNTVAHGEDVDRGDLPEASDVQIPQLMYPPRSVKGLSDGLVAWLHPAEVAVPCGW